MITGDYHHTAVAVAKDVGMIKAGGQVMVIDAVHKELSQQVSAVQPTEAGMRVLGTPQVSFQKRDADYAHGFFAPTSTAETGLRHFPGAGYGVRESEAYPAYEVSLPVAQLSRQSVKGTQPKRISFQEAQPTRLSPEGVQPRLSCKTRLSLDNNLADKAKLLPIEAAHSAVQASFEAALQKPPSNGRLVRAASLTRLPSQTAVAMAALAPQSQDDSVCATPSHALMGVGHRLFQESLARMIHPFHHTWDATPAGSHCDPQGSALKGLTFTSGIGTHHVLEARDALISMSEGSMQCAVTGDAFEYLLQMQDVSLLEAVLRNAVVFSRMQPHQKGQVMDLLGPRGIHQPFQAQPRHIRVCMLSRALYT